MNLCETCLFHCGDISAAYICNKYQMKYGITRYYFKKRDDIFDVNIWAS